MSSVTRASALTVCFIKHENGALRSMAGESTTSTISKAVEARFYPVPRAARGAHEARADVAWHRASVECLSAGAARDSRHAGRWALRGVVMMSGVFCRVGVQVLRHGQAATSQEGVAFSYRLFPLELRRAVVALLLSR